MIVITSFAAFEGVNIEPTRKALQKNAENLEIERVIICTEVNKGLMISSLESLGLNLPNIEVLEFVSRPSFQDLFSVLNKIITECNCPIAIMNSDVAFSGKDDVKNIKKLYVKLAVWGQSPALTLSRKDYVKSNWEIGLYDSAGLPNLLSADCWVFNSSVLLSSCEHFSLGVMNCDQFLNLELFNQGVDFYNPCLDISVLHYEFDLKDDSFYSSKNNKINAQDVAGFNWAKSCNNPFIAVGSPWVSLKSLLEGYTPKPYKVVGGKKLFVVLDEKSSRDSLQDRATAIFSLEIFAKTNGYDLVFLSSSLKIRADIWEVLKRNNRTYFFTLENIQSIEKAILAGEAIGVESCAFLNALPHNVTELQEVYDNALIRESALSSYFLSSEKDVDYYNTILSARYSQKNLAISAKPQRDCTLITSVFKSDEFAQGFFNNIALSLGYTSAIEHICLTSKLSQSEIDIYHKWWSQFPNATLLWKKEDPGLYESWNIGIRVAETEFVSNANVDDLRHPEQVRDLVTDLKENAQASVAASAIVAFEKYTSDFGSIDQTAPWYQDHAGLFGFEALGFLCERKGQYSIEPHNLPHCMPVWRKALHDRYGFFDEVRFGTFADWAFWLKITKAGELGYLNPLPLSFYFVNLESHNRRGNRLETLHREVEKEFISEFYFRNIVSFINEPSYLAINQQPLGALPSADNRQIDAKKDNIGKKLCLLGQGQIFGQHRNSFNKLICALEPLHLGDEGVSFIPFIERYFVWGDDEGEAASANPSPIQRPWIGILHVPFDAPSWFAPDVIPENIFKTSLWQDSLRYCRGMIFLSQDIARDFKCFYPHIPLQIVKHPTDLNVTKFSFEAYQAKPKVIQVGDWLRKLQAIYRINAPQHEKYILMKEHTRGFMQCEIAVHGDWRNESVVELDYLENTEYDLMLSSSVVLCLLYATAANNLVLECIARNTPIIINPLPSAVEYLGSEYPLYAENLEEAEKLISSPEKIAKAQAYLQCMDKSDLEYASFFETIKDSEFYENLEVQ